MLTLKKTWPVIVGVSLAAIAYAQVRGFSHLLRPGLSEDGDAAPADVPIHIEPADEAPVIEPTAFDSDAVVGAEEVFELGPPEPVALPTQSCDFGEVTLIVTGDPEFAFASIRTAPNQSEFYRIGSRIGERWIEQIGWDRVWFGSDDGGCQMELGDKVLTKAPPTRKKRKKPKRKGPKPPEAVPDHIAQRIQKLGENEYTIERSAFDEVFTQNKDLLRGTKVRPVKEDGDTVGVSLNGRGVRKGSLLHMMGVRPGDVLVSINGYRVYDPQKALEAYGRLRSADNLSLELVRDGQTRTIRYQVQ